MRHKNKRIKAYSIENEPIKVKRLAQRTQRNVDESKTTEMR